MKKGLLFIAVAAALCFSSCLRDEDKDLFKNPIHIAGSFSPSLGVPVGYGEVTLNQLIGMLGSDVSSYLDSTTDVLTIAFEFDTAGSINRAEGSRKASPRRFSPHRKDAQKDTLSFKDTTFVLYDHDVDIFQSLPIDLSKDTINIDSIRLALDLYFIGRELNINDTIADNVKITIDSLTIDYIDNNNNPKKFDDLKDVRLIDNAALLEGNRIDTALNVARLINDLPKHLTVKVRMRMAILSGLVAGNVADLGFESLLDSLQLSSIDYTAKVGVVFPFKLQIKSFPYEQVISLGNGSLGSFNFDSIISELTDSVAQGMELTVNEASINLVFQNNIPLELAVHADLLDTNDAVILKDFINDENGIIKASKLKWSDQYNANISDGPDPAQAPVVVGITDTTTLNKLSGAAKIKLSVGITTAQREHVAVRRTDSMGVRVFVKLRVKASIDTPILEEPINIPFINK